MGGVGKRDQGPAWLDGPAWDQPLLRQLRDLLVAILGPGDKTRRKRKTTSGAVRVPPRQPSGSREPLVLSEKHLPCELFLTMGTASHSLWEPGPIDELSVYVRYDVEAEHDVEYITRLDPEQGGGEDYRPYGLFRLRPRLSIPLPRLKDMLPLWEVLYRDHGLTRLPRARSLFGLGPNPRLDHGELPGGLNRLVPDDPEKLYKKTREGSYTYLEVLQVVQSELNTRQRIAWIEEAFKRPLPAGEIVHRYYLDSQRRVYLVRHHWDEGKHLYRAETSSHAQRVIEASGACRRSEALRRAA